VSGFVLQRVVVGGSIKLSMQTQILVVGQRLLMSRLGNEFAFNCPML
jgi:hypothetical protein